MPEAIHSRDHAGAPSAGRRGIVPPGLFAFSSAHFLAALVLLIFISPFLNQGVLGPTFEAAALTLVLVSGALAVGRRRGALVIAIVFGAPAVLVRWLEHFQNEQVPLFLLPTVCLLFVGVVIWELMRYILRAPRVGHEVVCAAIATFISMGFLWAFAYMLVARMSPNAFAEYGVPQLRVNPYDLTYFSFVTLTGVAFGDITPLSRVAKMLVVLEGLTGTFYIVVLIGRLVALYSSRKHLSDGGEQRL